MDVELKCEPCDFCLSVEAGTDVKQKESPESAREKVQAEPPEGTSQEQLPGHTGGLLSLSALLAFKPGVTGGWGLEEQVCALL